MSIEGPHWQIILFISALLIFALANVRHLFMGRESIVYIFTIFMLFIGYKAGFTRHDVHIVIAGGTIALISAFFLLWRPSLGSVLGFLVGLGVCLVFENTREKITPFVVLTRAETAFANMGRGLHARLSDPQLFRRIYEARLAQIRAERSLPSLSGTADIYSVGQSYLLASGLTWQPRPVIQSYSAYTASLAAQNAAHLNGTRAPDNVLFVVEPIDNRLASMDDGRSWGPLLNRYTVTSLDGSMAVLRRRPAAEQSDDSDGIGAIVSRGEGVLGQPVALPEQPAALWARIRLEPSYRGRIRAILFRPRSVNITFFMSNGSQVTRRLLPSIAADGFLIAPVVDNTHQLVALAAPEVSAQTSIRPVSFALSEGPGFVRGWRPAYSVELYEFKVRPQPEATRILVTPLTPADEAAPEGGSCYLDYANGAILNGDLPLSLGRMVRFTGWGFMRDSAPIEPTDMQISFQAADGTLMQGAAERISRRDVGQYFGHPDLNYVGFQALLDLSALQGPQRITLTMTSHGKRMACPLVRAPAELRPR